MTEPYHYKDLAEQLLADFDDYAEEICEHNERETERYAFSSQEMLRKAAQKNQDVYVQWLERCRVHFPGYIFNKAHEDMGAAIAWKAKAAGFEKMDEGRTESDIFGNPTGRITYFKR